jgi:arabinofuranosyltransferase
MASPRAGFPASAHVLVGLVAPAALLLYNLLAASPLTIDDSYISFRYARNLADGLGLVYNAGERIEGYTNFLWTLLLALGIKLGADPTITAKVMGGGAALGTLVVVYRLSERLQPYRFVPALATWLLASSMVFAGYAVLGLETALFIFFICLGLLLLTRESEEPARFPLSGLCYALAGLTRPEAPLYLGLAMLLLGRQMFARQNLIRGLLFAAVIGTHLLWRHGYYGAWLPNSFSAKTGNLHDQLLRGQDYLSRYLDAQGAVLWLGVLGITLAVARRSRLGLTLTATALAVAGYVVLVGGDWMPVFRFLAPFEPFAFLLVDFGVRGTAENSPRAVGAALAIFGIGAGVHRATVVREETEQFLGEKRNWDQSATALASWFKQYNHPGMIAMGDIGYVGWTTNYPILDILGLVDPVIAKLPGGYTTKQGPEYLDHFFEKMPEYFILISTHGDCDHPFHPSIRAVYADPQGRFKANYRVVHRLNFGDSGWCVYRHSPQVAEVNTRLLFDFENGLGAGWQQTGRAFENGPTGFNNPNQQPITGGVGRFLISSFHPQLFDGATGTLTSPAFTIDRSHLGLLVGGGARIGTRVEIVVGGQVAYNSTGVESENLSRAVFDMTPFMGREAQLRVIDEDTGPWGHILVDQVELFDTPSEVAPR